ncbi:MULTISPECIES: HAD family hydrolase [Streptomyces]|uniref:HAD family hydrolase n=1 Tax=Streptomyces TaxID=1883 RepID=UPI000698F43F|nr:HAD hydrolase-like protein [Streptomyces sp. SCSIO ZS0520]AYN34657.1 HAD family hydrolase [Streptomyces albus]
MASPATVPPPADRPVPTVGFDLDMTLVDTRPGIHATYRALAEETGIRIDADLAVSRLGPPLEQELAHWFPEAAIEETAVRYRELYRQMAIEPSRALPGARESLAAVREQGGRTLVVTAKSQPLAALHLSYLDLEPDALVGGLWAEAKALALREHGAGVYVGDHLADVRGARAAGALAVSVPSGPCSADELRAEGADVLLDDLAAFPEWFGRHARGAA